MDQASHHSCISGLEDPEKVHIRVPRLEDGAAMWKLVKQSRLLEQNTCYAYLLLCRHFADTCLIAEDAGRAIGFVAAYRPPVEPDVIFVWQIGVLLEARGRGLASTLLEHLVATPACANVNYLEATVAPSNTASQRLFAGFARRRSVPCARMPGFSKELFVGGEHEDEELFRIGPLQS
ncbi:MAG: diaminobutyrate acetyltransferase [Proteobacteria bacterium]|nr:diaminobutyrate acetyltransferase [Pseudomonadota bacterium]